MMYSYCKKSLLLFNIAAHCVQTLYGTNMGEMGVYIVQLDSSAPLLHDFLQISEPVYNNSEECLFNPLT